MRVRSHYYPVVVGMAIVLHLVWSAGLIFQPASIHATAIHAMLAITGSPIATAGVFAAVATLAAVGLLEATPTVRVVLIMPQHVALWVSVAGVVYAMWLGAFADGTVRDHWFLIVDQMPVVLIAIGHHVALLFVATERMNAGSA